MKWFLLTVLMLGTLSVPTFALPASKGNEGRMLTRDNELMHSWVSTDLSGDGLWLVVDTVYLTLKSDGKFVVNAAMSGGGQKTFDGSYVLSPGKIRFKAGSGEDIVCYFSLKNGVLTFKPTSYDVTVKMKRGEAPKGGNAPSPSMGMPGHF